MFVSSGEAYSNPYRPRIFVREWRRTVYVRGPGKQQQWDRYVRCENQRRQDRGVPSWNSAGMAGDALPQRGDRPVSSREPGPLLCPSDRAHQQETNSVLLSNPCYSARRHFGGYPSSCVAPTEPRGDRGSTATLPRIKFSSDDAAGEVVGPQ